MARYINPVPGQRLGRTDQGVDIAAPPGTPVYAIADERLLGILPNWFRGQPFYYFKELGSGVINYVAEQFTSTLRVGDTVQAGQQIGRVARSGTGLELGFAQSEATARLGHPTPSYTEGQVTPLGRQYRTRVFGGGGSSNTTLPRTSGQGSPTDWLTQAGWPVDIIPIMVAIGGAESGWRINASHTNNNGTEDNGWLQINSVHGFDRARLRSDPVYTARAGLKVYKEQGLAAWATYTNGAYKSFLGQAPGAQPTPPTSGRVRPGGDSSGSTPDGPTIEDALTAWTTARDGEGDNNGSSSGGNSNQFTSFGLPGPLSPIPGIPFMPDPLNFSKSIHDTKDFFKLLAWVINPQNILRMVELLVGMALMAFGFQAMLQAYGERKEGFATSENPLSRSGLGRVSKEVANAAVTVAAPEAKAAKVATGAAGGKPGKSRPKIRPQTAPHRTRRQALRLRYDREKEVSNRRTKERRGG